jgi:hypothetical protein
MSFKILKFSNRPSVFFPSNLLYIGDVLKGHNFATQNKPSAFSLQPSAFSLQHSAFSLQRSVYTETGFLKVHYIATALDHNFSSAH